MLAENPMENSSGAPATVGDYLDAAETGSVYSFVPYSYQDEESVYSDRKGKMTRGGRPYTSRTNGNTFVGSDRGHRRIFQQVRGKRVPVEFYLTRYAPGTHIRNAISGIRETTVVGRQEEGNYFKVGLSLPEVTGDQYGALYYSSPEEYERHFYTTVSQPIKEKWLARVHNYGNVYGSA